MTVHRGDPMGIGAAASDLVQVWWAGPGDADSRLVSLLDDTERMRLARFVQEADRHRYLVAHALARRALGAALDRDPADLTFDRSCPRCPGQHGKPKVISPDRPMEFSITHSGQRVAVAVSVAGPVGLDVEELNPRRDPDELAGIVLTPLEQSWLRGRQPAQRNRDVMRYWTRKEAVVKATGDGLSISPATVTVSAPDTEPALLGWPDPAGAPFEIQLFDLDPDADHVGCVAILTGASVRVVEGDGAAMLDG